MAGTGACQSGVALAALMPLWPSPASCQHTQHDDEGRGRVEREGEGEERRARRDAGTRGKRKRARCDLMDVLLWALASRQGGGVCATGAVGTERGLILMSGGGGAEGDVVFWWWVVLRKTRLVVRSASATR